MGRGMGHGGYAVRRGGKPALKRLRTSQARTRRHLPAATRASLPP